MNQHPAPASDFRTPYQPTAIDMPNDDDDIEVELADPWARMGAYILNSLISLVALIPMLFALIPMALSGNPSSAITLTGFGASLLLGLILLVWQLMWMTRYGQSIGKRIVGIKVVDLNGHNPGFVGTVLLREIVYILIVLAITFIIGAILGVILASGGALDTIERYNTLFDLVGYLPTIVCVLMLFRKATLRRTLQDYLAKTLVIKA